MHSETHSLYQSFTLGQGAKYTNGWHDFRSEGVVFPLKEEHFIIMSLGMEIINRPVMPTGQSGGKTDVKE